MIKKTTKNKSQGRKTNLVIFLTKTMSRIILKIKKIHKSRYSLPKKEPAGARLQNYKQKNKIMTITHGLMKMNKNSKNQNNKILGEEMAQMHREMAETLEGLWYSKSKKINNLNPIS